MAKSQITIDIENFFLEKLHVSREFAVHEVTLGHRGIVDILSYVGEIKKNGRGKKRTRNVTWRCYEIKVSKTDFYSKAKWTFIGHYNYFVMPLALYDTVKKDIPKNVGVYIAEPTTKGYEFYSIKSASRQRLVGLSHEEITDSMICSLSREVRKHRKTAMGLKTFTNREINYEMKRRKRDKIYIKR